MTYVEQLRGGISLGSYSTRNDNDLMYCGQMLLDFLSRNEFQPGDELVLKGNYAFGRSEKGSVVFPTGTHDKPVIVRASNDAIVRPNLFSEIHSDDNGSAFIGWNTTFRGISLEEKTWNTQEDGRCFGFDLRKKNGDGDWLRPQGSVSLSQGPKCRFFDCILTGTCWTTFVWFDFPVDIAAEGTVLNSYRLAWAMAGSGGHIQRSSLKGCTVNVDTSKWNDYGATAGKWGGGLGAVYRNGVHLLEDCTFNSAWGPVKLEKEKWGAPRSVGLTCYFGETNYPEEKCAPQASTKLTVSNVTFNGNPGQADRSLCWDMDIRHPTVLQNLVLKGTNYGTGEYRALKIK